jgi:hypothetical protein
MCAPTGSRSKCGSDLHRAPIVNLFVSHFGCDVVCSVLVCLCVVCAVVVGLRVDRRGAWTVKLLCTRSHIAGAFAMRVISLTRRFHRVQFATQHSVAM